MLKHAEAPVSILASSDLASFYQACQKESYKKELEYFTKNVETREMNLLDKISHAQMFLKWFDLTFIASAVYLYFYHWNLLHSIGACTLIGAITATVYLIWSAIMNITPRYYVKRKVWLGQSQEKKYRYVGLFSFINWKVNMWKHTVFYKPKLKLQPIDFSNTEILLEVMGFIKEYAQDAQAELYTKIVNEKRRVSRGIDSLTKIIDSMSTIEAEPLIESRTWSANSAREQLKAQYKVLEEQEMQAKHCLDSILDQYGKLKQAYNTTAQIEAISKSHGLILEINDAIEENKVNLEALFGLARNVQSELDAISELAQYTA